MHAIYFCDLYGMDEWFSALKYLSTGLVTFAIEDLYRRRLWFYSISCTYSLLRVNIDKDIFNYFFGKLTPTMCHISTSTLYCQKSILTTWGRRFLSGIKVLPVDASFLCKINKWRQKTSEKRWLTSYFKGENAYLISFNHIVHLKVFFHIVVSFLPKPLKNFINLIWIAYLKKKCSNKNI